MANRFVQWLVGLFGAPPADCTAPAQGKPPQGGSSSAPPKATARIDLPASPSGRSEAAKLLERTFLEAAACAAAVADGQPPPKITPEDDEVGANVWEGFSDDNGLINTNHLVFQVGRYLYDAQVLYADAEAIKEGRSLLAVHDTITPERVMQLARRYCQLVAALGQLRADYNQKAELLRKLAGKRISDLMR